MHDGAPLLTPVLPLWHPLTRLGESQLLLPLALLSLILLWRSPGQRPLARRWAWGLVAAVGLTTASKLAFMGWGWGSAGWDFTGFSGHAMCAGAVLPLLAVALAAVGRTLAAFVASSLAMAAVILTAGAAMFPFILPSSSQPDASLTVWDSVSSRMTLGLMLGATLIFMPLIVAYTAWAYRVMRGKVTLAHIRKNTHTAY
mgnify:CR=1 FL=1